MGPWGNYLATPTSKFSIACISHNLSALLQVSNMSIDSPVLSSLFTLLTQLNTQTETTPAVLSPSLSQLNEAAKKTGLTLFKLENYEKARYYLTIAAAAGDVESQYAMATCETRLDGGFRSASENTKKWLRLAAAQDYIPALMRLGDRDSLAKANDLATSAAADGSARAMLYLYTLTQNAEWLVKATATGNPEAQYKLAEAYREQPELITNTVERAALIAELYQKSADSGYPEAVYNRAFTSDKTISVEEKQTRITQLALMGQLDGILEYGYALAGLSQDRTRTPHTYGLERNLPKAYAMLQFVLTKTDGALRLQTVEQDAWALRHQLSPRDSHTAQGIVNELQDTLPVVFKTLSPMVILGRAY